MDQISSIFGVYKNVDKMPIFTKKCKKQHFNWRFTEAKTSSLPMVRDFIKTLKLIRKHSEKAQKRVHG